PRAASAAAAAQLLERVLFAAFMALVFGGYIAALPVWLFVPVEMWPSYLRVGDLPVVAAMALLCFAWVRARLGYSTAVDRAVRGRWLAVWVLLVVVAWALISGIARHSLGLAAPGLGELGSRTGWFSIIAAILFTFDQALPAVGSGDSLARAAGELQPP